MGTEALARELRLSASIHPQTFVQGTPWQLYLALRVVSGQVREVLPRLNQNVQFDTSLSQVQASAGLSWAEGSGKQICDCLGAPALPPEPPTPAG